MTITLPGLIVLLVIAAICGAVGRAIAGGGGGLLTSIALGFIGALLGPWVAQQLRLAEPFLLHVSGQTFPIVWSIVGAALFVALLHRQHAMSDRFISHMLSRNIRIEEDLIDQLFNSSEKRLARTLLLLARYGKQDKPVRVVPKISQETLAEMIGTTRSRVNFFLNKFKKLGFIEYNGDIPLKINKSLLSVVLHD